MNITVGSDPEVFLFDSNKKKYISSVGLIRGSKRNPFPMEQAGFFIQSDNVAVEFNTMPANSLEEFVKGINYSLEYVDREARRFGLNVRYDASAVFDQDQLDTPEAQTFGCEPDYNAWTREINPRPKSDNVQLRSCGGHVHVGGEDLPKFQTVKMMDLFLGVPSVIMDEDNARRQLYGNAGACRLKSYGVEYRVLSNFWLKTKELQEWVYTQTLRACSAVENRMSLAEDREAIQAAINTNDKGIAQFLIGKYNLATV